jgi:hypothetical protein
VDKIESKKFTVELEQCLCELVAELLRAEAKHPDWPSDAIHASAILTEEAGELTQASLDFCYSDGEKWRMRAEAIQCGAMAIRFLLNFDTYKRKEG